MASRRDLKKVITFVVDELATEAFIVSYDSKGDAEAWVALFNKIFALNKDYISRASHVEPGLPARKYFDTVCISFNEEAKEILDKINALSAK